MKGYAYFLILLVFLPAQTLLLDAMRIGGVKPDLALVLVVLLGLAHGKMSGLLWGGILGGLVDLASIGTPGINLFFKAVAGLWVGILGKTFVEVTFWVKPLLFLAVSLLHDHTGNLMLYDIPPAGLSLGDEETRRALYGGVLVLLFSIKITRGKVGHVGPLFAPGQKPGY